MSCLEGFKGLNTVRIGTPLKYDEKILFAPEQGFAVTQICYIQDMVHGHFYSISARNLYFSKSRHISIYLQNISCCN